MFFGEFGKLEHLPNRHIHEIAVDARSGVGKFTISVGSEVLRLTVLFSPFPASPPSAMMLSEKGLRATSDHYVPAGLQDA